MGRLKPAIGELRGPAGQWRPFLGNRMATPPGMKFSADFPDEKAPDIGLSSCVLIFVM
jgi:hypothetical protein